MFFPSINNSTFVLVTLSALSIKLLTYFIIVWEKDYMDLAVKEILIDSNTNFDSLIKNIENNKELKTKDIF